MLTAWDCIGRVPETHRVRIVGGRTLYEQAIYYDHTPGEKVKLARLDGLRQVNRWVDGDTPVELVADDGFVEIAGDALLN